MLILKPIIGGGTGFSGACGLPLAWRALKPQPCALRFSAKPTRGSAPGAHVREPLHLTPDLCAPPRCRSLYSILYPVSSFLVLLCVWLRSYGHFSSHTLSMSPRGTFNKTHPSLFLNLVLLCVWSVRSYSHFSSHTQSMSPRGIFNKTHPSPLCTTSPA